jgi:hypothetical protein
LADSCSYHKIFYGRLKSGKSRSEALKFARNEIKAKYPNPFFWAVFILHGFRKASGASSVYKFLFF